MHEVAAALGIALTLPRTGMSNLTFNLDNQGRRREIKATRATGWPGRTCLI